MTLNPFSFGEVPAFVNGGSPYTSIWASSEFPRARNVYFPNQGNTTGQFPPDGAVLAAGRIVAAPPAFTGNPAHLYAYNGEQTSGALPLIVRVTDNVGRSLRDVRVQASNGESALSNADGWALFSPPASFGSAITVTAGHAKAIFPLGSVRQSPASIAILAGQGQMIAPRPFDSVTPFRIGVRDAAGFPIVDTAVQFSISNGAGRLNCASSPICTLRSDANGQIELGFVPGEFPATEYMQEQRVSVTSGEAPRRTIFVTALSTTHLPSLGWIAPLQFSTTGVVNSVLPNAIQVNSIVTRVDDQRKAGQPVPNIALSIISPLNFPDLGCDGEAGVVLTDSSGRANCPLRVGSRAGTVEIGGILRVPGNWNLVPPRLTVEIAPTELPYLRMVRGRDQTLPRGGSSAPIAVRATDRFGLAVANQPIQWSIDPPAGLSLQNAASATDASGEAVATVVAGSTPGTYTIRAINNGLSAETRVYVLGSNPAVPSRSFLLDAEPGVVGVGIGPNPPDASWAIEGGSSWVRTATPAGSGGKTIWFTYDFNESLTTSRTARFTIGGTTVEFVQKAGRLPTISWSSLTATSGAIQSFSVPISSPHGSYANVINLLIRDSLDGRSACYLAYSALSKQLYLVGDNGPETLLPPLLLPSSQSVSNSQCTVFGTGSFANLVDDFPAFGTRISFAPTFGGSKIVTTVQNSTYSLLESDFGEPDGVER
ncbi:MAG: Ig-like domain-containing protein [Acidobacteria bacterium]|nr:Ig-like domain-containing protein [Acidobacteriota bacterium]